MNNTLEILKALSDRNRLRIVAALTRYDELLACQITELLQVRGATASRHLSILHHAGLICSRKEGRWIYYRLANLLDNELVFRWLDKTFLSSKQQQKEFKMLDKIIALEREELCRKQRGEACCPKTSPNKGI